MLLRRGLEALSIWLGLAPLNFLVNWGLNPNPPPPGVAPAPSSPPCHHVCRWLSKCHLWSKYHRAVSPGGPLPELGPGHTLPSLTGSPRNRKTNRQPPGRTPLPLSAYADTFYLKTMSAPHFHFRGGGRPAGEGLRGLCLREGPAGGPPGRSARWAAGCTHGKAWQGWRPAQVRSWLPFCPLQRPRAQASWGRAGFCRTEPTSPPASPTQTTGQSTLTHLSGRLPRARQT